MFELLGRRSILMGLLKAAIRFNTRRRFIEEYLQKVFPREWILRNLGILGTGSVEFYVLDEMIPRTASCLASIRHYLSMNE